MTDNAGCVCSEMMGGRGENAASYKDKKSVPAFFPFFCFFPPLLIGLHLGRVIRHSAHSTESHTAK